MLLYNFRLDGKHVVYGQVVDGYDIIKSVEAEGAPDGQTKTKIKIANCGQI